MDSNITIRQITSPDIWNSYITDKEYSLHTQSWGYGDFYESIGERVYVFGVYLHDELVGGTLCVTIHARRGNFLYLPYGPIVNDNTYIKPLIEYLKFFAVEIGLDFIRMSPFIAKNDELEDIFVDLGFHNSPMHILAEHTWMLNLEHTEQNIFSTMNKNHRNLVSRCNREGAYVEITEDISRLPEFHAILDKTAKRHRFVRFSRDYIDKEFRTAGTYGKAKLLLGYLPDGVLDAVAIVYLFGNTCAYRHGASIGRDKKIPVSYLVQWEAIRQAKKNGALFYNFWGIAPSDAGPKHPFHGITHFKKGFGGFPIDLIHCQDLPLNLKYWITWVIEMLRKSKRGF
jgi:peptidoglycan pentaglycine glycine transferase (the first glycine)